MQIHTLDSRSVKFNLTVFVTQLIICLEEIVYRKSECPKRPEIIYGRHGNLIFSCLLFVLFEIFFANHGILIETCLFW